MLHLTSTSAIGGTETMVMALSRACDRRLFEMSVDSLGGPGLLMSACAGGADGQPTVDSSNWRVMPPWPWYWARLASHLGRVRDREFDIVQTYGLRADLIGRLLKRRFAQRGRPVRLICSVRSTDAWRPRHQVLLDRWTLGRADGFIANSNAGREIRIRREGIPPGRIATIHNGVELAPAGLADGDAVRRELGIAPARRPVFAHVANLRPMKGHGDLLAAVPRVLERFPEALFLLAGRDESNGAYEREASDRGLGEAVRFLGYHPRPREIMRAADVVTLPSHYEGCPVSILEAMAEQRPIVATRVGGIPELVRHEQEALLIEPADAPGLADALIAAADNLDRSAALATAARRRVESEFSLERMVDRYQQAYLDVLAGRPPLADNGGD